MHGLPARALAVGLRRRVVGAPEARVRSSGSRSRAVGDLADREKVKRSSRAASSITRSVIRSLVARPRDVRRARATARGGDAERIGVVRGVVVAREVLLEPAREAPVQLQLGVVGRAALGA